MRRPRGFTLVETMLTVALTVLAMLLASSIVVNLNRATTTAERYDRLLTDVRTVTETLTQSLRTSTVDYAAYADPNHDGIENRLDLAQPQTRLLLVSATGLKTVYALGTDGVVYSCTVDPAATEAANKCDGTPVESATWIPTSSTDSRITQVRFTVVPGSDPYGTARSSLDCSSAMQFDPTLGICKCGSAADCLKDQVCGGTPAACRIDPAADSLQPRVTVLIDAETRSGQKLKSPIETTVTSRLYLR